MKLEGKIAIVTGASSGMGRAIAYLYAKEGATVYAIARREDKLLELAEEAKGFAGKIKPLTVDLMSQKETEAMVDTVYEAEGKLDILVNNAGIMDDFSPVGDVTDAMLHTLFELNVFSPFYSTRKAVNIFQKQGNGNIINISSLGGLFGARAGAAYTASKHALIGLTKNTAFMYSKKNIRCNAICPGGIATEIGTGTFMKNINQSGMEMVMTGISGNPREGTATEVASVALFLASEDSSYVNGQCIALDGGWSAY
jgi:NAD(P)-dependent dehydrogenase (short-subunit alcohol dehydrogenase family)